MLCASEAGDLRADVPWMKSLTAASIMDFEALVRVLDDAISSGTYLLAGRLRFFRPSLIVFSATETACSRPLSTQSGH
jgi:hypothetical protein